MKNKVRLKKYLIAIVLVSIILLSVFLVVSIMQYNSYTNNFNKKLDLIVTKVQSQYPDISDSDIMTIINNNESSQNSILEQYGIDLDKDSVLMENRNNFNKFLILNCFLIVFGLGVLIFLFLMYDMRKDKEISEITKYIEEINRKNYTLKIDEISEDELSILKNEIYKTTVMLKENADNSLKDKRELKKSLEDISHQLKTPLTSILVILDNLIDDADMDKDTRIDFIRDIKREVTNINFLVQSLLKLSKFDSNTIHFIKENRLLKDIVNEAVKNVSMLCDLKNISIKIDGDKEAKIHCDFMWEVEAITNIIKNCVEHSNENTKVIVSYEQNSVYGAILVQDYAGGIDKKDLPHI